jgi:hypothetical protein
MSADDFRMPELYEKRPYNRALFLELKELVEHQQRVMDDNNSVFERRGMSPPPPDMFFRDKQRYVARHQAEFERETSALVASVSARGNECFLSEARCTANSATVSYREYLKSLARTGTAGITAFLARRLMQPVLNTVYSRNPRVVAEAESRIVERQAPVFLMPSTSHTASRALSPNQRRRKGGRTKKRYVKRNK